MTFNQLTFRIHALQRMFLRKISEQEVRHVLETGEIIEDYPEDKPYPSKLILGWCYSRPIHIVVADNIEKKETIIITVYEPDTHCWEMDFRRRKLQ